MTEPAAQWRIPWPAILTTALLAALVALLMRVGPAARAETPVEDVLAAGAVVAGMFLVVQQLHNWFWGVVTALLLAFHPSFVPLSSNAGDAVQAEAAQLIALFAAIVAANAMFQLQWSGRTWVLLALVLIGANAVAWLVLPAAGLLVAIHLVVGLTAIAVLAWLRRQRLGPVRPCAGNLFSGLVVGITIPLAGLLLASAYDLSTDAAHPPLGGLQQALLEQPAAERGHAFQRDVLKQWAWPTVWAVIPVMVWGSAGALRTGQLQLRKRRAPKAWLLALFAFLEVGACWLRPPHPTAGVALPLMTLAVLLCGSGVAWVFDYIWDRIRLPPPEERLMEE